MSSEENNGSLFNNSYTISGSDKLDWRTVIKKQLERCVQAKGIYNAYHLEILKLEDCIKTDFSGLDFRSKIDSFVKRLNIARDKAINAHLETYRYMPEGFEDLTIQDRIKLKRIVYFEYWQKRFEFDRDLLAEHRGLLWGRKKVASGSEMPDRVEEVVG